MPKKKTFRFYLVAKNCKRDFGMGVGVLGRTTCEFTDVRGKGWDSPLLELGKMEQAEIFMKQLVTVLVEEKVKGKTWDKDPMGTMKTNIKKL